MLIKKSKLRRIIREELSRSLIEGAVPQLYKGGAGLVSKERITTSKVDFEWGKYGSSKFSTEPYFVRAGGDLGSIQFKGDPYTYEKKGEKLEVVSAPESGKGAIGRLIDHPDEESGNKSHISIKSH